MFTGEKICKLKIENLSPSFVSNETNENKKKQVHLARMNTTAGRYFIENNRECTFRTCLREMDRAPFATMGNRYVDLPHLSP